MPTIKWCVRASRIATLKFLCVIIMSTSPDIVLPRLYEPVAVHSIPGKIRACCVERDSVVHNIGCHHVSNPKCIASKTMVSTIEMEMDAPYILSL